MNVGFFPISTEVILQEHKFRPITGRALMIGRQNTGLSPDEVKRMLARNGIPLLRDDFEIEKNAIHVTGREGEITDRAFFAAFSDCTVEAIDISDYESAEIVHDMSVPIPDHLKGQFDFIFDGSSLDNIFNVATAMQNISDLLKPGGRLVQINWSNSFPTAYAQLSPDWFMDYFSYHEYGDARVLVAELDGKLVRVWRFDPLVVNSGQNGYDCSSINSLNARGIVCFAEKSNSSAKAGFPVQMHYRGSNTEPYLSSALRFKRSMRPDYDMSSYGVKTSRPSISTSATITLLSDPDRGYDTRAAIAELSAKIKRDEAEFNVRSRRPINRLRSAIADGRLMSGVKRRLTG